MKIKDIDLSKLKFFSDKKKHYYASNGGDKDPIFLDIPLCVTRNGVHISSFSKDTESDYQIALEFDKEDAHEFIEFIATLLQHGKDYLHLEDIFNPLKPAYLREDNKVMYCKLVTDSVANCTTKKYIQTELIGFPEGNPWEHCKTSYKLTGKLKISGLCSSVNGYTLMRRMTEIKYEGPPPATGFIVDMNTNSASYERTRLH